MEEAAGAVRQPLRLLVGPAPGQDLQRRPPDAPVRVGGGSVGEQGAGLFVGPALGEGLHRCLPDGRLPVVRLGFVVVYVPVSGVRLRVGAENHVTYGHPVDVGCALSKATLYQQQLHQHERARW